MDVLHTLFPYISPSTSTALCQREPIACVPFLYQFECCTRSHFCNNLVIAVKTFPTDDNFGCSKEVGIWGSKIWAALWLGRNIPSEFFIHSCAFGLVCGRSFSCWRRITVTFCVVEISWKASTKFMSLNVLIWIHDLTTWLIHQNYALCIPETVAMTFLAEGVALISFQGEFQWWTSTDSLYVCSFKRWIRVSSLGTTSRDKTFSVSLVTGEEIWTHFFPQSFETAGMLCGTQRTQAFEYPKTTVMLFTLSLDTDSSVDSSRK